MAPNKILVMRHAEKPDDKDDPNLSAAGYKRAQELVGWVPDALGTPAFIFASAQSKHSNRAIETVTPLARSLGLAIDSSYADAHYADLAKYILDKPKYDGSIILICWHHGEAPQLLHHLKAPKGSYADPWPPAVFNVVYGVDYSSGTPTVTEYTEPF